LRHIFNFDRELLNRAIPNYEGFPQEEKMQCIDNALREPRKYMPMKLTRVLQALKAEHAENPELVQALDVVEQETAQYYAKKLPKRIGLGVDAALKWLPQELHMQALVAMAPALGALLTRVRLDVHGDVNTLNLQSFVVGEAGSGKSRFARIDAALMRDFYAESIANQRLNEQHRREKERKKNAKEVPVFDMLPERSIPPRHSVAQVLDMLNSNGGLHCYTFAEEADIMSGNGRQAFADTSAIRRVAYDASSYAQAYKSDTASRLTIERVLWNLTQCGTPDALYRAFRNFTDGELSRVAIARMPDNTFTPLIASRPFGEKERLPLEQLGRLLSLMEGEVKLAKLEKHVVEKIEQFRLECLKNFDRVAARTRLRIPVTTMRMVCALTCCKLAAWLVEKIDMAKKKPTWADGAKSAEEYLKSHPNAVVDHLTRMQDEEMMTLYDTLSEYLTDTQLYYFRSRIEQAYESDNYKTEGRTRRGKNDSVFERLPQKFDLRQAASAKGHATADAVIRTMVYQWCKQGLIRNVGNGLYEKL
jgi:ABC-type dipeptide/oligopeptide/nickel transport system ATPase subunit